MNQHAKGSRVAVYQIAYENIKLVTAMLKTGQEGTGSLEGLLKDIGKVAPFSVAFNWESCGECGKFGFGDNDSSMGLIAVLLEKGETPCYMLLHVAEK